MCMPCPQPHGKSWSVTGETLVMSRERQGLEVESVLETCCSSLRLGGCILFFFIGAEDLLPSFLIGMILSFLEKMKG